MIFLVINSIVFDLIWSNFTNHINIWSNFPRLHVCVCFFDLKKKIWCWCSPCKYSSYTRTVVSGTSITPKTQIAPRSPGIGAQWNQDTYVVSPSLKFKKTTSPVFEKEEREGGVVFLYIERRSPKNPIDFSRSNQSFCNTCFLFTLHSSTFSWPLPNHHHHHPPPLYRIFILFHPPYSTALSFLNINPS